MPQSDSPARRKLFAAATAESDPRKLPRLCAQARVAIHERDLQLAKDPALNSAQCDRERDELDAALRDLWQLENSD